MQTFCRFSLIFLYRAAIFFRNAHTMSVFRRAFCVVFRVPPVSLLWCFFVPPVSLLGRFLCRLCRVVCVFFVLAVQFLCLVCGVSCTLAVPSQNPRSSLASTVTLPYHPVSLPHLSPVVFVSSSCLTQFSIRRRVAPSAVRKTRSRGTSCMGDSSTSSACPSVPDASRVPESVQSVHVPSA